MQSYLFLGGRQDSLNVPVAPDLDTFELPAGVTGKETYIRDTLTVGDASVAIFRLGVPGEILIFVTIAVSK